MAKSQLYVGTRTPSRDKTAAKDALDLFLQSGNGSYDPDGVVASHVINHCIERGFTFEMTFLIGRILVRRISRPQP